MIRIVYITHTHWQSSTLWTEERRDKTENTTNKQKYWLFSYGAHVRKRQLYCVAMQHTAMSIIKEKCKKPLLKNKWKRQNKRRQVKK